MASSWKITNKVRVSLSLMSFDQLEMFDLKGYCILRWTFKCNTKIMSSWLSCWNTMCDSISNCNIYKCYLETFFRDRTRKQPWLIRNNSPLAILCISKWLIVIWNYNSWTHWPHCNTNVTDHFFWVFCNYSLETGNRKVTGLIFWAWPFKVNKDPEYEETFSMRCYQFGESPNIQKKLEKKLRNEGKVKKSNQNKKEENCGEIW